MPILNFITPVLRKMKRKKKQKQNFDWEKWDLSHWHLTVNKFSRLALESMCAFACQWYHAAGFSAYRQNIFLYIEILKPIYSFQFNWKLDFSFNGILKDFSSWKVLCGFIFAKYAMHLGRKINNISYWNGFFFEMCDLP